MNPPLTIRKGSFPKEVKPEDPEPCGCLYQTLRPALILMQMFGLVHNISWVQSPDQSGKSHWSPSKIYCIIVALCILQNPLRYFTCMHLWFLQNSINAILAFKLFHDKDKMKRFFALHDDVLKHYDCGTKSFIHRRTMAAIAVALVFFVINVVGYVISMFSTPEFFYLFAYSLTPFYRLDWAITSVPLKLVFCVNHVLNTAVWLFPMMLLLILCFLIVNTEVTFNKKMQSYLREDGTFTGDLSEQRRQFLRICDIIEAANCMFQNFFGFNILILVAIVCLSVYALANSTWLETNIYVAAFVFFWIFAGLLQLLLLSYGAGIINDKASEFVGVLHRIRCVDFNRGDDFELNMFLAKLNGPSIGFSAFDLFMIDKTSIMTVFGMVLSYLLFMVEMSNNGGSGSCDSVQSAPNSINNSTLI